MAIAAAVQHPRYEAGLHVTTARVVVVLGAGDILPGGRSLVERD